MPVPIRRNSARSPKCPRHTDHRLHIDRIPGHTAIGITHFHKKLSTAIDSNHRVWNIHPTKEASWRPFIRRPAADGQQERNSAADGQLERNPAAGRYLRRPSYRRQRVDTNDAAIGGDTAICIRIGIPDRNILSWSSPPVRPGKTQKPSSL